MRVFLSCNNIRIYIISLLMITVSVYKLDASFLQMKAILAGVIGICCVIVACKYS